MSRLPKGLYDTFTAMAAKKSYYQEMVVWRGFAKDLCEPTGLTTSGVYRSLTKLQILECVRLIKHGARESPSLYQLIKEPEWNDYAEMRERSLLTDRLELPSRSQRAQDSINRMQTKLNELNWVISNSLETRIQKIESQIHELNRKLNGK